MHLWQKGVQGVGRGQQSAVGFVAVWIEVVVSSNYDDPALGVH